MQIPLRLKQEIAMYLWKEMQELPKPPEITNDSPKNLVISNALVRGVQLGMERAITIINCWNKPNKGKVRAHTCSNSESDV